MVEQCSNKPQLDKEHLTSVFLVVQQQTAILYAGSAEDKARMHLLRRCCNLFQGNHPFHNYTKRRLYRIPVAPPGPGTLRSIKQ